jgi:hypothetical protein
MRLGPVGQQSFMQVARAVSNAERPIKSINKHIAAMRDNLLKTAGWQLSSSVIHGFMGAI